MIQEALIYRNLRSLCLSRILSSQPAIYGKDYQSARHAFFHPLQAEAGYAAEIWDSMIEENKWLFRWRTGPGESSVCRMDEGKVGQQIYAETSPELLTAFCSEEGRRRNASAQKWIPVGAGRGLLQGSWNVSKPSATYASTKLSEGGPNASAPVPFSCRGCVWPGTWAVGG